MGMAAFEQGEGPWVVATGKETAVRVGPLKEGEMLSMEVEGLLGFRHLLLGVSPIQLKKGQRYRFIKKIPENARPSRTCVEVILDG
jgi:hypothetical protein